MVEDMFSSNEKFKKNFWNILFKILWKKFDNFFGVTLNPYYMKRVKVKYLIFLYVIELPKMSSSKKTRPLYVFWGLLAAGLKLRTFSPSVANNIAPTVIYVFISAQ